MQPDPTTDHAMNPATTLLALLLLVLSLPAVAGPRPPNIVLLIADDQARQMAEMNG